MKKKLSDFRLQQRNGNKHSVRGMGMLDHTIATEGFIGAITAAADGEVFDGSARLETSFDRFGETVEPIIVRSKGDRPIIHIREDIPNAEDPKAKLLSIAANRISEVNYVPDTDVLAELSGDIDLSLLYFDDELDNLLKGLSDPPPPPENDRGFNGQTKEINCTCPQCGHGFVRQMQ
ncbi:hypothetical protein H6F86_20505 [Phormidium sp. FACHB-592]|uniref:Uncharacterized protein n=1 Tax=Stenomitos frigidus AS-A4 TaxID=2933935 RepID=A0ABV0KEE3_9CYAN|nr:hypothetical protein [Phormidium sp. FACHB-592]MBD2076214.1 hypothetical protein [Phormidium sp. FACHB-592]